MMGEISCSVSECNEKIATECGDCARSYCTSHGVTEKRVWPCPICAKKTCTACTRNKFYRYEDKEGVKVMCDDCNWKMTPTARCASCDSPVFTVITTPTAVYLARGRACYLERCRALYCEECALLCTVQCAKCTRSECITCAIGLNETSIRATVLQSAARGSRLPAIERLCSGYLCAACSPK